MVPPAMTDSPEESEKQSPFDFDSIEINIRINDEIVIEDELLHTSLIAEEELEMSKVDIVEEQAKMGLEAILTEYQKRRDGDFND